MKHSSSTDPTPPFWESRDSIALDMLVAIGLYYIALEPYGHVFLRLFHT